MFMSHLCDKNIKKKKIKKIAKIKKMKMKVFCMITKKKKSCLTAG